jgi:hypothetical protein
VASFCFDAEEDGILRRGFLLQGGDEFFGVERGDAVIGVGGCYEYGRIAYAFFDVVERGVGVEIFEFLGRVARIAVLGHPVSADSEFGIAEHVGNRHGGYYRCEKVRALKHTGGREEAAVGAAADGKLFGGGVFLGNEVFAGCYEVIEGVLPVSRVAA